MPRGLGQQSTIRIIFEELVGMFKYDPIAVMRVGGVQEYEEMLRWKKVGIKSIEINKIKKAIKRLETKKFIQIKKDGECLFIKLLDNGIETVLKKKIIEKQTRLPKGIYCYISFDIPERVRQARWALRSLLKRADFYMIHQSLWYTPRDVTEELVALVSILKIQQWIQIIKGESLTTLNRKQIGNIDKRLETKKKKLSRIKKEREQVRKIASKLSRQ